MASEHETALDYHKALSFQGLRVILSPLLTEQGDPVTVRRTWKERLLTRPWRPWQRTRTYTPEIPYRGAVRFGENSVIMHPTTWKNLKGTLTSG